MMYGNILINADSWKCRGHLLLCKFHRLEALDSIIMIGFRCTFLAPISFYFQFALPVSPLAARQWINPLSRRIFPPGFTGLDSQQTQYQTQAPTQTQTQWISSVEGGTRQTLDQTVKP